MPRTCSVRLDAITLTLSVRSSHVPATPGTCACPPSLPSVPTSRATRVTSDANDRSWSTIVLMASLSCRISPRTSTVILRDRSPPAMAVVTSAMFRTCAVRLPAIEFTLSVRSFHVPATPGTCACPPSLPSVPTSRATRVTLGDRRDGAGDLGRWPDQVLHEGVDRSLHLAPRLARAAESYALSSLALFPDGSAEPSKLVSDPRVAGYDVVECVGDLAAEARPLHGEPDGEVAIADLQERPEQRGKHERAINRAVFRCCHDEVAAICHCHTSGWGVERRSSQPRAWALSTSWTEFFARVLPRRIARKVSTVLGLI